MNQPPSTFLTPEQFEKLLAKVSSATGIGAPGKPKPKMFGLGCCEEGGCGPLAAGVYAMLAAGSPRLALAKARGVPLAPYMINVRANFPDTTTQIIPDVGSDVKIIQDTLIDAMMVRIFNHSSTANQNQFQAESDYYYAIQSGIEATLEVVGAPRYDVAPKFCPLSTLMDTLNGNSHWAGGWVLTYQQQLKMDFTPRILLPFAPLEVVCSFRTWTPVTQAFVDMSNAFAINALQTEFGIDLSDSYIARVVAL
jgi:hypothetical protein